MLLHMVYCAGEGYRSTSRTEREKTNKMQQSNVYYQHLSQHVSGIYYAHLKENKDPVLLHMVYCSGSAGCGW